MFLLGTSRVLEEACSRFNPRHFSAGRSHQSAQVALPTTSIQNSSVFERPKHSEDCWIEKILSCLVAFRIPRAQKSVRDVAICLNTMDIQGTYIHLTSLVSPPSSLFTHSCPHATRPKKTMTCATINRLNRIASRLTT